MLRRRRGREREPVRSDGGNVSCGGAARSAPLQPRWQRAANRHSPAPAAQWRADRLASALPRPRLPIPGRQPAATTRLRWQRGCAAATPSACPSCTAAPAAIREAHAAAQARAARRPAAGTHLNRQSHAEGATAQPHTRASSWRLHQPRKKLSAPAVRRYVFHCTPSSVMTAPGAGGGSGRCNAAAIRCAQASPKPSATSSCSGTICECTHPCVSWRAARRKRAGHARRGPTAAAWETAACTEQARRRRPPRLLRRHARTGPRQGHQTARLSRAQRRARALRTRAAPPRPVPPPPLVCQRLRLREALTGHRLVSAPCSRPLGQQTRRQLMRRRLARRSARQRGGIAGP